MASRSIPHTFRRLHHAQQSEPEPSTERFAAVSPVPLTEPGAPLPVPSASLPALPQVPSSTSSGSNDQALPGDRAAPWLHTVADFVYHCRHRSPGSPDREPSRSADVTGRAGVADADLDHLLDPGADPVRRRQILRQVLTAMRTSSDFSFAPHFSAANEPRDSALHDDAVTQFWHEVCSWGDAVQQLLDDPEITEITILGRTVIGEGASRGRVTLPDAFSTVAEPLIRATFLMRASGITWGRESPVAHLRLPSGLFLRCVREPAIGSAIGSGNAGNTGNAGSSRPADDHDPGLLIVMRRERVQPYVTLRDLIATGMVDLPVALLLIGLLHAGCSMLISGQPGTAVRSMLTGLLNSRADDRTVAVIGAPAPVPAHASLLGLVGLHGPALSIPLMSSVYQPHQGGQQYTGHGDRYSDDYQRDQQARTGLMLIDVTLGWTPDIVVAMDVVDRDEAGAVLQHAEAGYPVALALHAPSAEAALQRLARLAVLASPAYRVAGTLHETVRVALEAFHVVIHLGYAPQLRRSYVQQVCLVQGLGQSQGTEHDLCLLPIVEGRVSDREAQDAMPVISWHSHAAIAADQRGLVWSTINATTPPAIAHRLAAIPDHLWDAYCREPFERPAGESRSQQEVGRSPLLAQAYAALRAGAWQEALDYLDQAAQQADDPQGFSVRVIDPLLVDQPAFQTVIDQMITASCTEIRAALDRWDLTRAAALIQAPAMHAVIDRRRVQHPDWQACNTAYRQCLAYVDACRHALTQAKAQQRDGDLRSARQTLDPFDAGTIDKADPALALVLLTARQRILMHLLQQQSGRGIGPAADAPSPLPDGTADDRAALAQVNRDLEALHRQHDDLLRADTGAPDAGVLDAGAPDTGAPDAGAPDAQPGQPQQQAQEGIAPDPSLPSLPLTPTIPAAPSPSLVPALAQPDTPEPAPALATAAAPTTKPGWLDEALARSRERLRIRLSGRSGKRTSSPSLVADPVGDPVAESPEGAANHAPAS